MPPLAFVSGEAALRAAARRLVTAVKAAIRMRWGGARSWSWTGSTWGGAPWTSSAARGDARANSVVFACVAWMARTFPEAPLRVQQRTRAGDLVPLPDFPMTALVATPNPYYAGLLLWAATLADWVYAGNAYWAKLRNVDGRPTQLWWLPAAAVEPRWDDAGTRFLTHYEYTVDGQTIRLEPADVVHFRYGLDPENPRKGQSPLRAVLREILTDEEAALFSSALLRNVGVPGVVLAPDPSAGQVGPPLTTEEAEIVKADFMAKFGGERRGEPLVLGVPMKVSTLSFSPDQMDLGRLRELPEERITAVLGIPAGVVGLGAGLARNTYSNYQEGRQAAYESNLIPTQRLFAAELTTQLLPDFGDPARLVVDFDLSQVRILQPDLDALWRRLDVAVQGGWLMVDEARERVGLAPLPDEAGQVLYVRATTIPTAPDALVPEVMPEAPRPMPLPLPTVAARRALPAAKASGRASRTASATARGLERLRARSTPAATADLAAFFAAQGERVAVAATGTTKAVGDVDWASEEEALAAVLGPWYRRMLVGVEALTQDALESAFTVGDEEVARYLEAGGARIRGITATTREAVGEALAAGAREGEALGQLAARIRDLPAFERSRADLVARTELADASNRAALASYRASGVVHGVVLFDGPDCGLHSHDDPEKADGMRFALEEAADIPLLAHPNCRRAWGALTVDDEDVA
jgi:HK97 family phage portal protein